MKKYLLSVLLISIFFIASHSQSNGEDTFSRILSGDELIATPDAMAFHKYNSLPVNLYTGKVRIDLPLYEIKSGDINIPISLSYNSGGIKVDDIASNVGLGWNLNASGSVISITKDIPDQKLDYGRISEIDFDFGSISYYYASQKGYFREYDELLNNGPSGSDLYQGYNLEAEEDASPDIFIANAPGLSVRFILEKNNSQYNILPIDGSGVKNSLPITYGGLNEYNLGFTLAELQLSGNYPPSDNWLGGLLGFSGYNNFELVSTNGLKYMFDKIDLRESLQRRIGYSPINMHKGAKVNTMGHNLSKIHDLNNNREVNFVYDNYQKNTVQYERAVTDDALTSHANPDNWISLTVFGHIPLFNRYYNDSNNQLDEDVFKSSLNYVKYTKVHRLSEITFDTGKVEFLYNLVRQDTNDENALTEIIVKDVHGSVITRFLFDYSYFNSKENCSEVHCKRLKLERIRKVGLDNSYIDMYTLDYNYTNPLPKVKALQQDFLGYYNNNGAATPPFDVSNYQTKQPTLYYHKDKGMNAILPFPLQNENPLTIPGDFNLLSNDYSLSGTLKSVQYAAGGKSEFEYETHRFNHLGNEYTAGGARIKRQKLTDNNQNLRVLEYEYTNDNGASSGYINNLPIFGYPYVWDPSKTTNNVSFAVFDRPRSALELTDGSFIGYSQVIEKELGNGSTKHRYISPETKPNIPETFISFDNSPSYYSGSTQVAISFLKNNSAYPNSHYIDNDILRGKLLFQEVKSESNDLLKRIDYEYNRTIFNTINLSYRDVLDNYRRDNQNLEFGNWHLYHTSELNIERNLRTKTTVKDYLSGGTATTITESTFDVNYPLLTEEKITNSDSNVTITKTYYPDDVTSTSSLGNDVFTSSEKATIDTLKTQNRLTEQIQTEVITKNSSGTQLSIFTQRTNYKDFGNSIVFPEYLQTLKGIYSSSNKLEDRMHYKSYYSNGNVKEISKTDGIYVVYIWGYNEQYPVARIENANFSDITTSIYNDILTKSNADTDRTIGNAGNEGALRTALTNLRTALPNAMVTSYTYDPLIGVTSITDPRGYTIYYEYDEFNRLKQVKDADGKIVSNTDYHYKDQ